MPQSLSEADLKAALPDVTSPQTFTQLKSGATIRRDEWGIPHIKADNGDHERPGIFGAWRRFQNRFADGMRRFAENQYRKTLKVALTYRRHVITLSIGLLVITLSLAILGWQKFSV